MPQPLECQGVARALMAVAGDPTRTDELYGVLGEFCHGVRNRLNGLKLSLYLAKEGISPEQSRSWAEIQEQYLGLEQFVDQFQTIFRPMALSLMPLAFGRLVDERKEPWERLVQGRGGSLFLARAKGEPSGHLDPLRFSDALDRFVSWRAEQMGSGTTVYFSWKVEGDEYRVTWEERPSAVPRPHLPAPEVRESAPARRAELALPMLTRIVALHGGDTTVRPGENWAVDLRWPLMPPGAALPS